MSERILNTYPNPLASISPAMHTFRCAGELPYNAIHQSRKLKERREFQPVEAAHWLEIARDVLTGQPNQDIFKEGDEVISNGYVGAGATNTCFRFGVRRNNEVEAKQYVLKIGGRKSSNFGYPSATTKQFAEWYLYNLNIIRAESRATLPYLIPEPQEVVFATDETHPNKSATLVIQPFYSDLLEPKSIYHLKSHEQQQLLDEFTEIKKLSKALDGQHGIIFDLASQKNLTIARTPTGPHFVLIDNEIRDRIAPAPVLNSLLTVVRNISFLKTETRLKRAVRNSQKSIA